jgi:cation transporter-like permease
VLEYRARQPLGQRGKTRMSLLIVYVVLVIAGDFVAYFIGLAIERTVPAASLPAFLAMYFLFLWVAWVIAVRITQPRAQPQ